MTEDDFHQINSDPKFLAGVIAAQHQAIRLLYAATPKPTREKIAKAMGEYCDKTAELSGRIRPVTEATEQEIQTAKAADFVMGRILAAGDWIEEFHGANG